MFLSDRQQAVKQNQDCAEGRKEFHSAAAACCGS